MRKSCCDTSLTFALKFLNLFQLFVGISIILYSVYMLNCWDKHLPVPTLPPPAPSPDSSDSVSTIFNTVRVSDQLIHENFGADMMSSVSGRTIVDVSSSSSPWFIYAFMGLGVTMCCISCMGYIAADAINGCCLYFYALLKTVFILLEVAFILFIALDRHWERDLPSDPTREIGRIREFVEANIDFCKCVAITIVVIQALCILLAVVLRAMITSQMKDDENDIERDSDVRGKAWEPLLNPRPTQTSVSVSGNGRAFHSDIWTSRMREKYGLSSSSAK
ncbi:tetraspanin-18-like [Cynara cardunculus var. scolymus]|uniref:Tetraspanin/Peripherin n=1 Tax=Cynara cardunculus var. scolymus TaxID=59895 RepID=A0A118K7J5_CYNCS|nr:tetraspanin-18-like [Cynara cardunculus var. scolymus]KVI12318.1 Tetraspanin/Peripherin [Cynara cardunculus var. scolymus]